MPTSGCQVPQPLFTRHRPARSLPARRLAGECAARFAAVRCAALVGNGLRAFRRAVRQSGATDLSFTGQNSDTSTGDYDFLYREYSTQGRWASPDPAGLAAVDPANPQSWNRYAYVLNNPLSLIDPFGLDNDCGGACTPFSYYDGHGCLVTVTYHKETGPDGTIYDIPDVTTNCSGNCPMGSNFVPVPFGPGWCIGRHILGDFVRERPDRDRPRGGNSSVSNTTSSPHLRDN